MNIMNTKGNMIQDYDAVLDAQYGKEGSPERIKFEENAYAYYNTNPRCLCESENRY